VVLFITEQATPIRNKTYKQADRKNAQEQTSDKHNSFSLVFIAIFARSPSILSQNIPTSLQ
jgi:hypothetical protein